MSWKQLESWLLIFVGTDSSNRPLLDLALSAAATGLRPFYEVQRSSTAVGLVAQGLGAAVVPRLAMQKDAYPNLRIVALTDPVVVKDLVLVSRATAQLSPAAQALYDMVLAEAKTRA
jgi:DNA-binding transcriptional LysR family regulator